MLAKLFRYLFTGGGATLVDLGVFKLVFMATGIWGLAFIAGVTTGLITNFLLSRRFAFQVTWQDTFKQFAVFSLVALNGILLNLGLMQLGITILHLDPFLARILSAGIGFIVSFIGHNLFSFRKEEITKSDLLS